jgi:hypothetical protein
MDHVEVVKTAEPVMPTAFENRLGDNWRLMLAIADLAGGQWPEQARQAAMVIAKVLVHRFLETDHMRGIHFCRHGL